MFYLISYDVVDDKRRANIAKALLNFGDRVQKSVFECDLEENRIEEVKKRLRKLIDPKEDSIRYYSLCLSCRKKIDMDGIGVISSDPDYFLI